MPEGEKKIDQEKKKGNIMNKSRKHKTHNSTYNMRGEEDLDQRGVTVH